uniref:Uncharacterized protein n=1 Tax=Amphiprion percula TaxID=161767 RepID=A0A3P8SME8_AMPPE
HTETKNNMSFSAWSVGQRSGLLLCLSFCHIHRIYNRACTGNTGILVKAAAAIVGAVLIFIIGYVTGYYVHRC